MKKYWEKVDLFSKEIKKIPGVLSVLIAGSLARDEADDYSDIDIEVYVDDDFDMNEVSKILENIYQKIEKGMAEIEFFRFSDFAQRQWSLAERWDKSFVKILFDTDKGMKNLLVDKVVWNKGERDEEMKRTHNYAFWYGKMVAEVWIKRGDLISAHKSIDYALDYLVQYLFLLNEQYVPHMKWRYNRVVKLDNVPKDLAKKIGQILLIKELNHKEWDCRQQKYSSLLDEVEIIAGIK